MVGGRWLAGREGGGRIGPGAAWGRAGADDEEVGWRGRWLAGREGGGRTGPGPRGAERVRMAGRWDGAGRWLGAAVWGVEAGLRVRCVRTGARRTYGGPGLLVCSFFLSRLAFLSSSVFLQCLFSFRLICLECKRQGVFL